MKRLIVAAAAAPWLAGCAAQPIGAQQAEPAEGETITVHASARVERAPDRATVRFAVETSAAVAEAATRANAEAMHGVHSALREAGVPMDAITTQQIWLRPRYSRPEPGQEPHLAGYAATNRIEVELDDPAAVGTIIDVAIEAGANRVDGLTFRLSDPAEAREAALRQAVERARREAGILADALGTVLGRAISVSTTAGPEPPSSTIRLEARPSTPVEPGMVSVSASVTVVFLIDSR